ncbi:hypothetical protein BLOT_009980 [Blomia tropicalis]|nr:hypothetical protein BLOT_009980 [Blomia tropicalis]
MNNVAVTKYLRCKNPFVLSFVQTGGSKYGQFIIFYFVHQMESKFQFYALETFYTWLGTNHCHPSSSSMSIIYSHDDDDKIPLSHTYYVGLHYQMCVRIIIVSYNNSLKECQASAKITFYTKQSAKAIPLILRKQTKQTKPNQPSVLAY